MMIASSWSMSFVFMTAQRRERPKFCTMAHFTIAQSGYAART